MRRPWVKYYRCVIPSNLHNNSYDLGNLIISVLQVGKLRIPELSHLSQVPAGKWQVVLKFLFQNLTVHKLISTITLKIA